MDWVSRMNGAIDYIEGRMLEDIDYSEAARIACCSEYHFMRMFSFMTDVALSEYIRRRRLTLAAFELQNSDIKVIDLALKFGYDSPEAFARAFQQLHGTTPTAARSAGTKLKAYPRMSFQLTIKGVEAMNYRIEELTGFKIVGAKERFRTEEAANTDVVAGVWEKLGQEGFFDKLWDIRDAECKVNGILGVCANGAWGQNEFFDYYFAVASDQAAPEGMVELDFPSATWAVFDAEGPADQIGETWRRLYTEWVPVSAYDLAYLPAIENYLPPEANKNELWIPVVPKIREV